MEQMDPELTPDEASLNEGDVSSASQPTSGNASMIHPDEDGPHRGVLNEDVLENVFKHIINRSSSSSKTDILKDVQNIRLVCTTWKDVVTLLYRRAQAPTVFDQDQAPRKGLKTFLEVMKNSDLIPVQNYTFNDDYFRSDNEKELFSDFLLTCGSDIVSLNLSVDTVKEFDVTGLDDLKLEKLKRLEIRVLTSRTHTFRPFLKILMNSAVAIEKFNFGFDFLHSDAVLMQQFTRIVSRGLPTTVKILHLSDILLDEKNYTTLSATGLKLEELQLDASCFSGNGRAIREFLENQGKTIKTLLIKGYYYRILETTDFQFPKLNELQCLEMNGIPVKPFSFTKTFPKLQKLDVVGWDKKSKLVELLSYEKVVPSVKEIIMPVSNEIDEQLTETISDHFPNITTLRISLLLKSCRIVKKTLQEVFIHFPNIEQLYIKLSLKENRSLNADSIFSGVSEAGCKQIQRKGNFADVNLMVEQSMPSILNLTKLKKLVVTKLELGLLNGFARFFVTDMAAHYVFLQMASLKELSLSCVKMSPKYIELLENKLDLEINWNCFHNCANYGYEEDSE